MSPDRDARAAGARAVLLDLGEVLVHLHFERALERWTQAAGITLETLRARHASGAAHATHERYERGECDFAAFADGVRAHFGLVLEDEPLREGWNAVLGDAKRRAHALVERAAARTPVFLFSNTDATHHAVWARQHARLLAPMSGIFVSHELGNRKPEPTAFAEVVLRMGLPASEIAFFDDRADNVEGAARAGLMAWQVQGPDDVLSILGLSIGSDREALASPGTRDRQLGC